MRQVFVLICALVLFSPVAATANNVSECRYLSQQIAFFEMRAECADELGQDSWEERFEAHVEGLSERRSQKCPGFGADEQAQQAFMSLIKLGAQAALTYFTMGAM